MKTGFVKQLRVKLKVYSEMIGKNKLESIYDALSIAKTVREKGIDLKRICTLIEKENELLRNKLFLQRYKKVS